MTYSPEEERTLSDFQADLDLFISQRNWKDAQAIIDNVRDLGFEHEADIMRKSYLRAQNDFLDLKEAHTAVEAEHLAMGEYDSDNYRPEYPRE